MRFVATIAAVFVGALALATGSPAAHAAAQPTPTAKMVTVQSGDTLDKIAKAHGTTYTRLFDANTKIADPDVIYAGQSIRIPAQGEKLAHRALPGAVPAAAPATTVHYAARPAPAPASAGGVWDRLAACESGGNWAINTGNGFYGGLQFTLSSWQGVGGSGYPHQASKSEQIARAQMLQARQGWGAWPACSARLGLL